MSTGQKAAGMLGMVLLFAALSCFIIGNSNLRLANRTKPTIHILMAADLIANGPGDNAYVRVEQATPLVNLYVVHRDRSGNENWRSYVYVPLAPSNGATADQDAPRIFLRTNTVWEKPDLAKLKVASSFEGIVYRGVDSLPASAAKLIRSRFPYTDFANCYVIKHNARPPSRPAAIVTLVLGGLAILGFLALRLLIRAVGPRLRG